MNIFTYLGKKFYGISTHDSEKLIAAKKYQPSFNAHQLGSNFDLHKREIGPFMLGAIKPISDACDLLDSKQIEKKNGWVTEGITPTSLLR